MLAAVHSRSLSAVCCLFIRVSSASQFEIRSDTLGGGCAEVPHACLHPACLLFAAAAASAAPHAACVSPVRRGRGGRLAARETTYAHTGLWATTRRCRLLALRSAAPASMA